METSEALKILNNKNNQKIVELMFLDYYNQPSLFKTIGPNEYLEYKKGIVKIQRKIGSEKAEPRNKKRTVTKKKANNNLIANFFKKLDIVKKPVPYFYVKTCNIKRLSKKGISYDYPVKKYILKPEFFFQYAEKELKKDYFNKKEEQEIWNKLNNPFFKNFIVKNYPKQKTLLEKIKYFLLDFYIITETNFYIRFFKETLDNYEKLLNALNTKKEKESLKEIKDFLIFQIGEWRIFGSDEEQVMLKKSIGEKILKIFGYNRNLPKEFSNSF